MRIVGEELKDAAAVADAAVACCVTYGTQAWEEDAWEKEKQHQREEQKRGGTDAWRMGVASCDAGVELVAAAFVAVVGVVKMQLVSS